MKISRKWIMRSLITLFIPLTLFASWAAFEVNRECRGHQFFVSKAHTDDQAVTSILHRGRVMWSGILDSSYQPVTINEVVEGTFDIETKFSSGSVRQSDLGYYVTTMDRYHYYINIGELEDSNARKKISLFSTLRNDLSCLF